MKLKDEAFDSVSVKKTIQLCFEDLVSKSINYD